MKKLRPLLILTIIVCLVIFGSVLISRQKDFSNRLTESAETTFSGYNTAFNIGDKTIDVEIADTPAKMSKGLSGRNELPEGNGMLFVYPSPRTLSFWMPDMNFPIDIVFIKNNKVIYIEHSVPNPPTNTPKLQLKTYTSPEPVDTVLEVPAGWCLRNNIDVGSIAEISTI